jgi:ABC-2 type transport system permease protein
MNKIILIIKREYLTRVRNRTFLLSTFLFPLVMILFIFGSTFFAVESKDSLKKVAVINDPGMFKQNLKSDSSSLLFDFAPGIDSSSFTTSNYDALLDLRNDSVSKNFTILSKKQLGIDTKEMIENRLDRAFETNQLLKKGISNEMLDSINKQNEGSFTIDNKLVSEQGKTEHVNALLNNGVGMGTGFLIYITLLIFGTMVMRGVMEEKTNRIAEVMISSVKPFELMMGKIIGIAAVGLTQFLLWIILIVVLSTGISAFIPHELIQHASEVNKNIPGAGGNAMILKSLEIKQMVFNVDWLKIICCFFFYFLGGYLFYASIFASIGSAVNEDAQEAQSLVFPVTMPLIFSFIILSANLTTPDSSIMVWASIIPFTSPVVMMGRIPSGVPWEQLVLSMALLIAGFLFTAWVAGKIYRTGILMYGKKPSWKEMIKWAFRKS